jgi:hypothetical protein
VRKFCVVATVAACLAVPSTAAAATASGTILSVGENVVDACDVFGVVLRTASGENVNLAAGGVTPLGSQEAAIVQTLREGQRQGSNAVVTVEYVASRTLCGYALSNYVTSASLTAAPHPPPLQPPPPTPPTTPSEPAPVAGTASGIVTQMPPISQLVVLPHADGTTSYCRTWPGTLRTDAGQTIDFVVETPLAGNLQAGGLNPTDPAAFKRYKALLRAAALRRRATVRIEYGPVKACGKLLPTVVTSATVTPRKTHKKRGRITRISRPVVISGAGTTCKIWTGALKTRSGRTVKFTIETDLGSPFYPNNPNAPADPSAARIVKFLKHDKALGKGVVTTITSMGPINACGRTLRNVVTNARQRFV